ncbi:MAG TPA: DUF711 family protein [Ktedonobacteraceae bacterium]|jgi:uncharacterized protein (UPF0210 family)|nr:DUF711 family protein [Ktedonobacteraceae bacterium]
MPNPPIRTITLGIEEAHPLTAATIKQAAKILQQAGARFQEAGYEVQTTRLSTRPIFDDLAGWSNAALLKYAQELQAMLDEQQIAFCSIGTAQAVRSDFPLERIEVIADLLASTSVLNATVQLATIEDGLRAPAALTAARIMARLASETEEGFGNFRFAMLACVPPGCPFFPAAYHSGTGSLSIGLQGAGIIAEALHARRQGEAGPLPLIYATESIRDMLIERATPAVEMAQALAREHGLVFGGIDLSPAPMGEDSIVSALELAGYGAVGSTGTVALSAAVTSALKSTALPTCGYCGLMLPVLEDAILGRRWEEGLVTTHQLLLYSAICGTGLDTVPLAGDIPVESIAHLLLDVATLALRLNKPLSARLFPAPGKHKGEYTSFSSPYLTNTVVR